MTLRSIAASLALALTLTFVAGAAAAADLMVTQTGGGAAAAGSTRTFAITASSVLLNLNPGVTVTVTTTLVGATPTSASGTGWFCPPPVGLVVTCTRSNGLTAGVPYPPITVTAVIGSGTSYSSCAVVANTINPMVPIDPDSGNNTACVTGPIGAPSMGRLCVVKFNDLNGSGSRQGNEPFLAGWTFNMTGASGAASGSTDGQGRLCKNVPTGSYTVTETMQTGWVSTTPGGLTPSLPAVVTEGNTATLIFGNRQPPAPIGLTVEKLNESTDCHIAGFQHCKFRIRIRNTGSAPYSGPVTFSDSIGFAVVTNLQNITTPIGPLPTGWTCSASGPPVTCSGTVNLAPNQTFDVVLLLKVTFVHPIKNCVHLTAPITTQPFCLTL